MPTTVLKNTGIKELMEVSSGNFEALKRMTEEFRRKVQEPIKRPERFSRRLELVLEYPRGISVSVDLCPRRDRLRITINQT